MLAILNSLNAHNLPIFQPILMILVSKFMVHRALSDKTYLLLGLLSPLKVLSPLYLKISMYYQKNCSNVFQNIFKFEIQVLKKMPKQKCMR